MRVDESEASGCFTGLKLCSYASKRAAISVVAVDVSMSSSEVHAAIKRLQQSRLLHEPELHERPNVSALEESGCNP
jgi:hypothetical protein